MSADIIAFFDPKTKTISYLVADQATGHAVVIDPVLDYDPAGARTCTAQADRILHDAARRNLRIDWVLETHPHADHLSACAHLKARSGAKIGIGAGIVDVQRTWQEIYDLHDGFRADGSQFDRLLRDGERLQVGSMTIEVMSTPGHTPACVTYLIGDCAFVGDTLFMPDYGTARCDFPGGDAHVLYRSIRRILALPLETRLFACHDYAPGGRAFAWESTVSAQRADNIHIHDGVGEDAFAAMRSARDRTLSPPDLILPAIQVNIRAGELPPLHANGFAYLMIPLNAL